MKYRSENIDAIIGILIEARPQLLSIQADRDGNRGAYIGRDKLLKEVNTILATYEAQIVPLQEWAEGPGLMLRVELHHKPSKQWISSEYTIDEHVNYDAGDTNQKKGGSITYGLRYTIGAMLGISIGDDEYKPQDNAPRANTGFASDKQVAMLNARFIGYADLKSRVFEKLKIKDMKEVPSDKVTGILDWLKEETTKE